MAILYITDLDGTLLDEEARVSAETRAILNDLMGHGLPFTVATARTHLSALPILRGLNLTLPLVLLNGCMLYCPQKEEVMEYTPFSQGATHALVAAEVLAELTGLLLTIRNGTLELHCGDNQEKAFHKLQDGLCPVTTKTAKNLGQEELLFAMYTDGHPEKLQRIYDRLRPRADLTLDFYRDRYEEGRWYLELFSATASKKTGVLRLKELCGAKRLVCFGDALNDLPMFEACDESYAVENAHDEVKRKALASIGKNTKSGVAHFIRAHFLKCNI